MTTGVLIDRCAVDPAAHAQREDAWAALLTGLTPPQRGAIVLVYRQGLSTREAAGQLGLSARRVLLIIAETIAHLRETGKYRVLRPN